MDPGDILHLQIDQLLEGLVGQVYQRFLEDRLLIKIRQTRKLSKQNIARDK